MEEEDFITGNVLSLFLSFFFFFFFFPTLSVTNIIIITCCRVLINDELRVSLLLVVAGS